MRARLHHLHSPDVPDLRSFKPVDGRDFGIFVQAMIGPDGQPGEEAFGFVICTPHWFAREVLQGDAQWGRGYLFVAEFDLGPITRAVETVCEQAEGASWQEVAARLGRYWDWEFDDYRPFAGA